MRTMLRTYDVHENFGKFNSHYELVFFKNFYSTFMNSDSTSKLTSFSTGDFGGMLLSIFGNTWVFFKVNSLSANGCKHLASTLPAL